MTKITGYSLQYFYFYLSLFVVHGLTTSYRFSTVIPSLNSLRGHKLANLPADTQRGKQPKSQCLGTNNATNRPDNTPTKTETPGYQLTVVLFGSLSVGNACGDGAGAPYAVYVATATGEAASTQIMNHIIAVRNGLHDIFAWKDVPHL